MSILAWFRGLFGKPSKKRQTVDNGMVYVDYITDKYPGAKVYKNGVKWQKVTDFPLCGPFPPCGPLNEVQIKFMFARFATSTPNQVARKLNKMGYLTPRGKKWRAQTVRYWQLPEQILEKRREYWRQYDKKRRQPQTMIFRTAQMAQRQNGIN
jgi:hypothetical protein